MKSQVADSVSNILESLRIKSEYSDARDDILEIILSENPLSEKNEKIAKRLMEIIEPQLYEAMCIMEKEKMDRLISLDSKSRETQNN